MSIPLSSRAGAALRGSFTVSPNVNECCYALSSREGAALPQAEGRGAGAAKGPAVPLASSVEAVGRCVEAVAVSQLGLSPRSPDALPSSVSHSMRSGAPRRLLGPSRDV
eukprot:1188196-Prorocentrum_minimum.AAC.2